MTNYCTIFNTHNAYMAAANNSNFLKPHVSLCGNDKHVHFDNIVGDIYYNFALKFVTASNEYIIPTNDIPVDGIFTWEWFNDYLLAHNWSQELNDDAIELYIGNGFYQFATDIGSALFGNSNNIQKILIGSQTIEQLYIAGETLDNLVELRIVGENQYYDSRNNCNAFIEKATDTIIQGCGTTVIPNTVIALADFAFASVNNLTSINIPGNVESIGNHCFEICRNLTTVTLNEGLLSIGQNVFNEDPLTSITIPDSVTYIGDSAFDLCEDLTTVVIGSGITEMGDLVFGNCTNLESVTIYATTPPEIMDTFDSALDFPIYVPAESVNAYKTAGGQWDSFVDRIFAIQS